MKAIQLNPKNLELVLKELPIPKPKDDEILVKVLYSGVCGTDLHIIEGHFPFSDETVTLGHEFCGVVVEVGKDVTTIKKGDTVGVDPNSGCSVCVDCFNGNYHYCKMGGLNNTIGIFRNGGWAEYVVVPVSQAHIVSDKILNHEAVLMEPISCISHGWDKISPLAMGSKIIIQGAGIIGNLWACILHHQGHRKVTMVEPQDKRRNLFKKLDLGYECVTPDELKSRLSQKDWGVDLVIDCSGYGPAIEDAIQYLLPGGKLCIFGVASPETLVKVSPYTIFKKELQIIGVLVNPFSCKKSLEFIEGMGKRYLIYENLGIQTFSLNQYKEAINALKKGLISKAIFKIE